MESRFENRPDEVLAAQSYNCTVVAFCLPTMAILGGWVSMPNRFGNPGRKCTLRFRKASVAEGLSLFNEVVKAPSVRGVCLEGI